MFAVMQKGSELKPVHSDSDFKYLQDRGWSKVEQATDAPAIPKRRGRPTLKLNKPCQSPITQS